MVQIDTTRISSKGQIVIPARFRGNFKEGENLVIIENGGQLILKKESAVDKNFLEDLEFARRTEKAWKEIEAGRCTTMSSEDFLKEISKW
jgi:AbrB family looped-hinge helix DNA binding protein